MMLNRIYAEQKATNRSLHRIANILLMGLFAGLGNNAKARGDEHGTKLCRLGVGLTAVSQCLLIASDIAALIDAKKEDNETDSNE